MKQKLKNKIMPTFESHIEKFKTEGVKEEESGSDSFAESSESDSESDEDDRDLLKSDDPMVRRRYWLKKTVKEEEKKESPEHKPSHDEDIKLRPTESKNKVRFHETKIRERRTVEGVGSKEAEAEIKKMNKDFYKLKSQEDREDYLVILDGIKKSSEKYNDSEKLSIRLVDIPIRMEVSRQMKLTHFMRVHWLEMFSQVNECFEILRES